jgi:signal transduction histidine kinase/AmiR/NasT family two-component response regulator
MQRSILRETLERFYHRAYGDYRALRLVSIASIAAMTAYTGVWSIACAVLWASAYAGSEIWLVIWWRRIQPRLAVGGPAEIKRLQSELIGICAISCAICAVPGFLTPLSGHDNKVMGVILSAAILLVAAAEHSLRKDMFLLTAPPAAAALIWNLYSLGDGLNGWMFGALGLCYVGNALALQQSNAKVFLDLLRLRADAEAANVAKSDFLATVSHEIRTPLNGVLGMAQLMARSDLTAEQRGQLNVISDSGQALLVVLNGILDLSKIESGKLELEARAFDLEQTVEAAAAAFAPLAAEKGLMFSVEVAPSLRGSWQGDTARISQVMSNLLSNALKFTAVGAIRIGVEPSADSVAFSVADTGIGIPADKLGAIFEKFTQADSSTTRRFGGTGLGLAICERFVALMGGQMTVESKVGVGSTFSFVLPLRRDIAADQDEVSAPEATDYARPIRILAAEDNSTNRLVLSALLETLGVDLTVVDDGEEAVEAFAAARFDVVLMDMQMPRMDGVAATAAIRGRERLDGRSRTPIIALTANVMPHQIERYRAAGMDAHVAKPVELPVLVAAINDALASHVDPAKDGLHGGAEQVDRQAAEA